ncbi:MAG: ExbD/TolR family protein [Chitinophagales bacterium]
MSEILPTGNNHRRVAGVRRMKRHNLRTDMTPMVDLGFLLITFFVFTVELSKPVVTKLNMPKEGGDSTLVRSSNALTILLGDNDRIYYYHGNWEEANAGSQIFKTNLSETTGLGKLIREKQNWLDVNDNNEKRNGLMLLIKAGKGASYKNVIDALDEAVINAVTKYTILRVEPEEASWMEKQIQ